MNIQEGFPLGWTGLISLQFKRLSRSSPRQFKSINSLALSFLMVQLSHPYMTTEKTIALTRWTFIGKVVSLLFNVAIIKKTLCNPVDYILPGAFVHGIFQAIVLEWIAISFSRGSSQPRDWTWVSHIVDRCFTVWATREVISCVKLFYSLPVSISLISSLLNFKT